MKLLGTVPSGTLSSTAFRFQKGDVLYGRLRSYLNKVWLAAFDGLCSTEFIVLPETDAVSASYLRYRLNAPDFVTFAEHLGTGDRPRVDFSQLAPFPLLLPPKPTQCRIAGILDKADRLRRVRRYALELSDQFLPALFLRMFGDPTTNPKGWETKDIGDALASATYGTSEKSNNDGRGYHIIGMACLADSGDLDLSRMARVELNQSEFEDLRLRPGDIIFNRTNSEELVGKTAVWRNEQPAVLASYLVRLRLKPKHVPEFFAALLNTNYYKRLFRLRCRKAVNQANISPTLLAEFPMYDPPEPLQKEYDSLVREQLQIHAIRREALRQAEHLFQSLLSRCFGKEN